MCPFTERQATFAIKFSRTSICFFIIPLVASVAIAQSAPPQKTIAGIAKSANGAVVSIIMSDKNGQPIAQGSGFLVSKNGNIVTNYHVIAEGTSAVAKLPSGAFYVVDGVLAFDKARDIAVIKAHGENFRTVALGDSSRIQVGEEVVAIGNPLSLESTVSNGIISAIRTIKDEGGKFLQVTTPISPGSSGGPLFNMEGQVVGITTMYLKGGENLNFAIPINDAKHLLSAEPSKVQNFPDEQPSSKSSADQADAFTHNRSICLDGVIASREVLPGGSLGPESYGNVDGKNCSEFIVPLPLSPEDAELLEANSPEDDALLSAMETQKMNALTAQIELMQSPTAEGWARLGGVIWQNFEENRKKFCSHHPDMLVFDLNLQTGDSTIPTLCSKGENAK